MVPDTFSSYAQMRLRIHSTDRLDGIAPGCCNNFLRKEGVQRCIRGIRDHILHRCNTEVGPKLLICFRNAPTHCCNELLLMERASMPGVVIKLKAFDSYRWHFHFRKR